MCNAIYLAELCVDAYKVVSNVLLGGGSGTREPRGAGFLVYVQGAKESYYRKATWRGGEKEGLRDSLISWPALAPVWLLRHPD